MKKTLLFFFIAVYAIPLTGQTVIMNENFETGLPPGWSANPATGAWTVGDNSAASSLSFTVPAHTSFAYINDDGMNISNPNSLLISPVLNLTSVNTIFLNFDAYFGGYSNAEEAEIIYSLDGGTNWLTADSIQRVQFVWQNDLYVDLTGFIAGQSNVKIGFRYKDNGFWQYGCCIDNVKLFIPEAWDASLSTISPTAGAPNSYILTNSPVNLSGTIRNLGENVITSAVIKYRIGSTVYPMPLNNLNIPPLGLLNFTHSTPYNMPTIGSYNFDMWVELSNDSNLTNDTLQTTITAVAFIPNYKIVFEEGTGTWCGFCPSGAVYFDSIYAVHPNDINLIAVHNGDPMTNNIYDVGFGNLIAGYPTVLTNRALIGDGAPTDIFSFYNQYINNFGFANLTASPVYDPNTRMLTVTATANFATNLTGDYRLALAVTEDNVTGTTSFYDQHNYFSGGTYGPMGGYENLPDPVPASQMVYNHVAREILGGFTGASGSLPAAIVAGTPYTYTFNWTVPASYNANNMHLVLMLIDNNVSPAAILNSAGSALVTGINNTDVALQLVSTYPNPSQDGNFTLSYSLQEASETTITITDILGNTVMVLNNGTQQPGDYKIPVNANSLAAGSYFVTISTNAGSSTCPIQLINQ